MIRYFPENPTVRDGIIESLERVLPGHNAIPILVHDWSKDPLLLDEPERIRQLEEAQLMALKRVAAGEKPGDSLKYFLKKSALFRLIEQSLGVSKQEGH